MRVFLTSYYNPMLSVLSYGITEFYAVKFLVSISRAFGDS